MSSTFTLASRSARRYVAKVTIPDTLPGIAVETATIRAHVAQPLTDDDTQLAALEQAAQAWVQAYLGRAVLTQTRVASYDGAPGRVVHLPEPITAITTVRTYDDLDVATTVTTDTYRLDTASTPPRLILRDGQLWPTSLRDDNSLVVTYVAGWANAAAVPKALAQAIHLLVAHWYEHRSEVERGPLAQVPLGVEALLMPYRLRTGLA